MIVEFFKERDCHTLIRPLTEEKDLKNLFRIKLEDLRPEFVDQVFALRKKLFSGQKIKKLKD